MNTRLFYFLAFAIISLTWTSCDKEDDDDHMHDADVEYHAHILQPSTDDKHAGHTIPIEVEFEDHKDGTIHHINVRIYNAGDGTEIYNSPSGEDQHVHASMKHTLTDSLTLDVAGHTDWVMVAKVWGMEAGMHEATDTVRFHVHPR